MKAKFKVGDNVLIISTKTVGTVNAIIERNESVGYRITSNGRTTTYNEKYLDVFIDEEQEILEQWDMGEWGKVDEFSFFMTSYRLKKPIEGNLYSYLASKTIFNPYQFKPLSKFISMGSEERLFIADEVGVGKTIETGIILLEMLARGQLDNRSPIMIVCPNSLGPKWIKEMKNRFDLDFHLHDGKTLAYALKSHKTGQFPDKYCWSVVGLQLLRHSKYKKMIETICISRMDSVWKMIVIDESHHMRNSGTESNELGQLLSGSTDMMLMLSATPLNLKDEDFFNQMHILNPAQFPDSQTFDALIGPVKSLNRCRRLLFSKDERRYELLLLEMKKIMKSPLGLLISTNPIFSDFITDIQEKKVFSDSDLARYERTLISLSPLDNSFTRTLKREAIPHRVIREPINIGVDLSPEEMEIHEAVIEVAREAYLMNGGNAVALGFVTNMPRRMASSCIPAALEYLEQSINNRRMLVNEEQMEEEIEDDSELSFHEIDSSTVAKYAEIIKRSDEIITKDTKYDTFKEFISRLLGTLENKQIIVFSFFIKTLRYLEKRMKADGYNVGLICGEMPVESNDKNIGRYEVMEKFEKKKIDILLSSEVGGEGLDFQFCQVMINYDLPYNPMRIEQRIGRIDRFGQPADKVIVASMYIKDTVDERIFNVLYERIRLVEDSIGFNEPILESKISDLQSMLISGELSEKQINSRIQEIELAVEQSRLEMQRYEDSRRELLGDDYFSKTILNIENTQFVTPMDAVRFTKICLEKFEGCEFKPEEGNKGSIVFSDEMHHMLKQYMRKPGCESSYSELSPLTNSSIHKVIFDGSEAIRYSNYQFLPPCGNWIKFLISATESSQTETKVFKIGCRTDEVSLSTGDYVVCVFETKTEGFKTDLNIAAVPIRIREHQISKCDYVSLARVLSRVTENSPIGRETDNSNFSIEEYIKLAGEELENQQGAALNNLIEENRFRIEARVQSLRQGSEVRKSRIQRKIDAHIEKSLNEDKPQSPEFIRLMEAQIRNEFMTTKSRISKLNGQLEVSTSTSLIGLINLEIRESERNATNKL